MVGNLAVSLAGHDKGQLYIIIREEGEYVYLCDGSHKKLTGPKRKNKKHIQMIKTDPSLELRNKLRRQETVRDEEVKRAIKLYGIKTLTKSGGIYVKS